MGCTPDPYHLPSPMSWRSWILTSNDFAKDLNNLNAADLMDPSPTADWNNQKNTRPNFDKKRERIARYQQGRLAWYTRQLLLCRPFWMSCGHRGLHRCDRAEQKFLCYLKAAVKKNKNLWTTTRETWTFPTTWAKAILIQLILTHLRLILK